MRYIFKKGLFGGKIVDEKGKAIELNRKEIKAKSSGDGFVFESKTSRSQELKMLEQEGETLFRGVAFDKTGCLVDVQTGKITEPFIDYYRGYMATLDGKLKTVDKKLNVKDTGYMAVTESNNVRPNSVSFYMRNLRAVYNRAVARNLTPQRYPFKGVYTGLDKTVKRAVPLKIIKQIKNLELASRPALDFARDMFLFSFYTRGMSFVDMAYLQKRDLRRGVLSYHRRKTGQQLFIKWEKCMQDIVDKYYSSQSKYLLPIINPFRDVDERKQYIYTGHNINSHLKVIGAEMGLSVVLTMYVARHSWASIAKSKNVPLSVISDGLGHDSETTTRIYLASLDTEAIDQANNMILKSL